MLRVSSTAARATTGPAAHGASRTVRVDRPRARGDALHPRGPVLHPAEMIRLQRLVGNRAVGAMVAAQRVPSGPEVVDHLEREAAGAASRPGSAAVARHGEDPPSSSRPGRGLRADTRETVERRFGWNFGGVRINSDGDSADRVDRAGARAITTGEDIAVGASVGDLEAGSNRALLEHELAHVVQQTRDRQRLVPGGLAETLSASAPVPQPAPVVTAVNAGPELGAGGSLAVTATAAGNDPLTWSLVGAPAGVTITPRGRRGATIRSAPTALGVAPAGGGTVFQAQAALTATPGDSATSANIVLVSVDSVTVAPAPAMINVPMAGGATQPPPANILDPNRDGLTGNTGAVAVTTAPVGRATTVSVLPADRAAVAGTTITPGTKTGVIRIRARDNATGTVNEGTSRIDSMPTKVTRLGPAAAAPAGRYGSVNPVRFGQTDSAVPSTRVIGETITAGGSDDFGLTPLINAGAGGPNPVPIGPLSAPANGWNDQLFTGHASIDVNNFVGPNAPGGQLPAVWRLRQGFHAFGWNGVRAPVEFDDGTHTRSLIKVGGGFAFRTVHTFPGAQVSHQDPYAAVHPLITLTGITGVANVPAAAGGIAADGVATGNLNVVSSVPGRTVVWSIVSGPVAVPNAPIPVATPAVLQSGLVPGRFQVKVVDQAFPNRQGTGRVTIAPVRLTRMRAAPSPVPAGTLVTNLTLDAAPGGRTVNWSVDGAAGAAGVTVVGVPAAAPVATTAVLTRPAAFTGTVTVTASDSVLPHKTTSLRVRFR